MLIWGPLWVSVLGLGVDLGFLLDDNLRSWGGFGCQFAVLGWSVAGII